MAVIAGSGQNCCIKFRLAQARLQRSKSRCWSVRWSSWSGRRTGICDIRGSLLLKVRTQGGAA